MNSMAQGLNGRLPLLVFAFFALVFFFSSHYLYYSLEENFDRSTEFFESKTIEGSLPRRIAFLSLGLFALIGLMGKGRKNLKIDGTLGWLLVFFAVWSLTSISWSIDPILTLRRLGVFTIFCVSALAMASRYPVSFLPSCAFFITTLYLCIGLSVEIVLGTFNPFWDGYRFAGTLHPNIQGLNCAIMFLAAVSFAGSAKRGRALFLSVALIALTALVFTKSRTSFASALLAQAVLLSLASSKSKVVFFFFSIPWLFCFLYLFLGDTLISTATRGILLGREAQDISTLTGRTHIWETCLDYVARRPLHGYGFNSFWTSDHIREFSNIVGAGIIGAHSTYLDLSLNIGLLGLGSYVLILAFGIKSAFACYKKTQETAYGFIFVLLIFFSIHGLLESEVFQMSSLGSFLLIWGLLHLGMRPASPRLSYLAK